MLSEKQIEDVFAAFGADLIEPGLAVMARQFRLPNKLRMDLLFEDRDKKQVIVELKRNSVTREDVGQVLEYAGLVPEARVILAAPHIALSIKKSFEHYGIGYLEFSQQRVEELYRVLMKEGGRRPAPASDDLALATLLKAAVPEPLSARTLREGNIAFKVTYNDKGWSAPCSPDVFRYNAFEKKVVWCSIQAEQKVNCQSPQYVGKQMSDTFAPCYDAAAVSSLVFGPGWNHGQDRPFVCKEAKVGKIAVLTSRAPGEPEQERFIFAILDIERITTDNQYWQGVEFYHGRKSTSLVLPPGAYLKFWNHYANPRSPGTIMWGTGLFRYLDDACVSRILEDTAGSAKVPSHLRKRAEGLLGKYRP